MGYLCRRNKFHSTTKDSGVLFSVSFSLIAVLHKTVRTSCKNQGGLCGKFDTIK